MAKKKIKIGIIFGGRSGEHEVSLVSAESVIKSLDQKKYEIVPIGITKRGEWIAENFQLPISNYQLLDKFKKGIIRRGSKLPPEILTRLDVVFPVLHGSFGEDGTIQGLLEMLDVPYVGAGVLGSAIGMDKVVQKQLWQQANLPIVKYEWFLAKEFSRRVLYILRRLTQNLKYPMFVKPANSGSSVGISKVRDKIELVRAIKLATQYDRKIIVEQAVLNVREIECSVLGNDEPKVSLPGEIISCNEFYDYDAKYVDGKSRAVIPADLSIKIRKKIRDLAVKAFIITNCAGMARVDFLLNQKTGEICINEINTIPGFTSISMYPKLWQVSGLEYSQLLDSLIKLAIERHQEKKKLQFHYQPKKKWY